YKSPFSNDMFCSLAIELNASGILSFVDVVEDCDVRCGLLPATRLGGNATNSGRDEVGDSVLGLPIASPPRLEGREFIAGGGFGGSPWPLCMGPFLRSS